MNVRLHSRQSIRSVYRELIAMTKCVAAIGLFMLSPGCSQSQVQPRVVAVLPSYSEGIVFDGQEAAFVSVLNGESVYVIRGSGPPAKWYHTIEPNGHKVLPDGTHLVAAKGGVHHVDPHGNLIEVLTPQLETPNDLALDGDDGVYITVPAKAEQDRNANRSGVYYLDSARILHKVSDGFCYPNGIVVRPDGKTLLVNDSCNRRIHEFQIESPGILTGRRIFTEIADPHSVPDGMTLDNAGLLYMADYGTGVIRVFGRLGDTIRELPTGLQHASNVSFGGDRFTDLYVTGSSFDKVNSGRLVVLPLRVRGSPNARSTSADR